MLPHEALRNKKQKRRQTVVANVANKEIYPPKDKCRTKTVFLLQQLRCRTKRECWFGLRHDTQRLQVIDGRVAGHLGPAVGLKTLSIHVCICPHFGM